jgi:hypothetical protein
MNGIFELLIPNCMRWAKACIGKHFLGTFAIYVTGLQVHIWQRL